MNHLITQETYEWILLLTRWLHITVGVTWIGTSIFFMWLDRSFENGELWMVHGGGFYQVRKLQMGSTQVPEHLHWFKWESYWTWMSGIALLILVFYLNGEAMLLDSTSSITFSQSVILSVSSIVLSWLFYDFLWETKWVAKNPAMGHALTLLWFGAAAYVFSKTFTGRAAYMHLGALIGTWMSGNVFLRIIPRQLKMVEAAKRGEKVNEAWAKNAKNRSTHNTYFTLPIIFLMLSNHFPQTYGNSWSWLVVILMSAAGASIRHFFILRLQNPKRSRIYATIGVALIAFVIYFTKEFP